jgi:hypothetical protein
MTMMIIISGNPICPNTKHAPKKSQPFLIITVLAGKCERIPRGKK